MSAYPGRVPERAQPLSRRGLLALGAGGVAALAVGCGSGGLPVPVGPSTRERPACVRPTELDRRRELAGLDLVYEVSRRPARFWIEPAFAGRLETWLTGAAERGVRGDALWTYGTWTDGTGTEGGRSCSSWHDAGRAFDLARIRRGGTDLLSCRYDQWRSERGATLRRELRRYWTVAASLHRDFAYVLTYLYDAAHRNHIHVDNGRSGAGPSVFEPRSPSQVQAVQTICTQLWSRPVEVTGRWDPATRWATGAILDGLNAPDDLTDPAGWRAFLDASAGLSRD